MAYYDTESMVRTRAASGEWDGVTTDTWGDVVFDEDIPTEDLKRFARQMYNLAIVAQDTANSYHTAFTRELDARKDVAAIFGAQAKAAAIAQRWCNEYEDWRKRIQDALCDAGHFDAASAFKEASERRAKFNVTVEVLATEYGNARDFAYNIGDVMRDSDYTYGCEVSSVGEIDRVPEPEPESPVGDEEDSYYLT